MIPLLRAATPYTPTLSELIIENIEQPLKCDAEFTVTIKYYFVGETVQDFKTDIVYSEYNCFMFIGYVQYYSDAFLWDFQFVIGVSSVCFRSCPEEWSFIMDMRRLKWSLLMEQQVAQCRSNCLLVLIWLLQCRFWPTVFCLVKMLLLVAEISLLRSVSKTRYTKRSDII